MTRRTRFALAGAAGAVALSALLAGTLTGMGETHAKDPAPAVAAAPASPSLVRGLPDFTELVAAVGPAVVNISTMQRTPAETGADLPFQPGDPMYEFFRRFAPPQGRGEGRPTQGVGSGFIISADGYVLTNAHVVAEAGEVTVKLTDKRDFKAKVVGSDKRTDIALLKIDAKGLPFVKLGDASQVKVGEWVVAVGSPFGFDNTVTAGIVSAVQRSLPDETYVPFIQTDVAINPGNSGGPLFNLRGEVIGINSQIYSRTGGFMGLSFAIPVDVAMKVKDQLAATGRVSRGKLGLYVQPLTKDLAESFGLKSAEGALVANVERDGPAAAAGVQSGDIITTVNGKPVKESRDLPRIIGDMKPGENAKLGLLREGKTQNITVKLAELSPEKLAGAAGTEPDAGNTKRLGVSVRALTAEEARQMGVAGGVMVEKAGGPAAQAGIEAGDAILALNGQPVKSPEDLRKLLEKTGHRAALLVQRGENRRFVPIRLG